MKKILYRLIIYCSMLFCCYFMITTQKVQGANIKINKKIAGTLKDDEIKTYCFEIKSKQQIELVLKSSTSYAPEISVHIYRINGMNDYEVDEWLEKHEEYWWNDNEDEAELYDKYESDKRDKSIVYKSQMFSSEYDSIKFKRTLLKGKYYIIVENEDGWGTAKFNFILKKILLESETIKLIEKAISLRFSKTKQLKATDKNGTPINYKVVTYSSSNKKVATVSKTGKITAKNAGTCKITAKLKNGKKAICKVTVPELDLAEKLLQNAVYATVDCVNDKIIYNDCWVELTNNTNKNISYVELQIVQYNNKWDKLYRPYKDYYINKTIIKKTSKKYCFYVNDDTSHARACIMKVYYEDGTIWTNPLYGTWSNEYL